MAIDGSKIGGIILSGAIGGIVAVTGLTVMSPLINTKGKPASIVHPMPVYRVDGDIRTLRVSRSSDLSFHLVARINNKPVNMLIDTGATITVLTQRDALAAGIPIIDTGNHIAVTGINKKVSNYLNIGSWNIAIGPIALSNVRIAIDTSGELPASILGQNAFCRVDRITVENDIIEFLNRSPVAQGCDNVTY